MCGKSMKTQNSCTVYPQGGEGGASHSNRMEVHVVLFRGRVKSGFITATKGQQR